MGGSCKGGCLEDAKAVLAMLYLNSNLVEKERGYLACLRTHLVSNSTVETESSSDLSALETVARKYFGMDSGHMGFGSIAGSWERKARKVRVPSLANTFLQLKNLPVPGTVPKDVANE